MLSFQERSKLGIEKLSEQPPVTLDKAKKQAQTLKEQSSTQKNPTSPFCD